MSAPLLALAECRSLHEQLIHAAAILRVALSDPDMSKASPARAAVIEAADTVETALPAIAHAVKALADGPVITLESL